MPPDREDVLVESRAEWAAWLAARADDSPGCWALTWRKGSGHPVVPYDDLVEEALRVGWIDSQARGIDSDRAALLMTPRKSGSGWSAPNKERIARLEAAGLILPRGQAVLDAARADGSWTLLDAVERLEVPPDLAAAMDAVTGARTTWDGFPRSPKRAALEWLVLAKRPETRAARIAHIADACSRGERPR